MHVCQYVCMRVDQCGQFSLERHLWLTVYQRFQEIWQDFRAHTFSKVSYFQSCTEKWKIWQNWSQKWILFSFFPYSLFEFSWKFRDPYANRKSSFRLCHSLAAGTCHSRVQSMYLTWVIFLYLPIFIYKDERGETDAHKHFACLSKSGA